MKLTAFRQSFTNGVFAKSFFPVKFIPKSHSIHWVVDLVNPSGLVYLYTLS